MDLSRWITLQQAHKALQTGTGKGVKVAILDSGIDVTHPALDSSRLVGQRAVIEGEIGPEIVEDSGEDLFGHGTAVAYLVQQTAPAAEIGSYKVFENTDGRCSGRAALLEAAVTDAIASGYHIINCSFGTPARPVIYRYFKSWIDAAYLAGVHVVTACNNLDYTQAEWPAHFPSVIAVNMGHVQPGKFHYRAGQLVEFFAHGDKIRVPWLYHEWKKMTGSSYAAPVLAGLTARLLSCYPGLSAPLVKAVLREVAEPWSAEVALHNVLI
jgi:hypothetical protein